jgi:hypothetical protein
MQDCARARMETYNRLDYMIARRAILDYLRGRFGDCSHGVPALSERWSAQQPTATPL